MLKLFTFWYRYLNDNGVETEGAVDVMQIDLDHARSDLCDLADSVDAKEFTITKHMCYGQPSAMSDWN